MTEIDEATRKRLTYVKRLYTHGHEHIPYGTEFDRMIAVHHFDNAIELLLKCVATKYEISFRNPLRVTFPTLWDAVNKEYKERRGSELPKKTEMFQLHDFRCDVQHWGVSPVSLDIVNSFDVYTLDFIQIILDSVFGLEYNELFMSSLVSDTEIKGLLIDAERCFADENWKEVIHKASIAFALAKREALIKRGRYRVPTLGEGFIQKDSVLDVLVLGIDYEEYKKFQKNTPTVFLLTPPSIQETGKLNYTRKNALFCFNFVLDSILRWRL